MGTCSCGGVEPDCKLLYTYAPDTEKEFYSGHEILDYFLPNLISSDIHTGISLNLHMSAWSMMYSMELINRIKWEFVSERHIIAEDVYSLLDLYGNVRSVSIVKDYLYFYCRNDDSLTRSYSADRYWKIKRFYLNSMELCNTKGYSKDIIERMSGPYLSFTVAALKQESEQKRFGNIQIRQVIVDDVFQDIISLYVDKFSIKRNFFFWAARKKFIGLCELLLCIQAR